MKFEIPWFSVASTTRFPLRLSCSTCFACGWCRYDTRKDVKFAADAPVIGLVLQRSHLVTGDEGHYSGVVSELEARGAKVRSSRGDCGAGTCRQWL
jgi:hypothetical protein